MKTTLLIVFVALAVLAPMAMLALPAQAAAVTPSDAATTPVSMFPMVAWGDTPAICMAMATQSQFAGYVAVGPMQYGFVAVAGRFAWFIPLGRAGCGCGW